MEWHATRVSAVGKQSPSGRLLIGVRALPIFFLLIVVVSPAWGIDPVLNRGPGAEVLILTPVLELHQDGSGPVIIGGQPAITDDYPVSLWFETKNEKCTGFLIGARVLMTAAHCVSEGTLVKIKEDGGMAGIEGHCHRAPKFPSDPSQDLALCSLTKDYPLPDIPGKPLTGYEVLNTDPSKLMKGNRVQITGFGCTLEGGSLDNIYRVGWSKIDELPPKVPHAQCSIKIRGQSQLCKGDSGGPAFAIDKKSPSFRRVIGINSKTSYTPGLVVGFLASTSTKDALDFFRNWAKEHDGQKICGVHKDAEDCRPTK